MWQVWIILAGIFIVFEMIIPTDFLIFWVGIGAIITAISSIWVSDITAQVIIFAITSVALIFLTKPFVKKFTKDIENVHTNAYSIIGKEGIVISDIDNLESIGQVKIENEVWSAKTNDSNKIVKGTKVVVDSIEGVKVIVSIKKEEKVNNEDLIK